MALGRLKQHFRKLQREGRATGLVNAAGWLWYHSKNIRDWWNFGAVRQALKGAPAETLDGRIDMVLTTGKGALRPLQNRNELTRMIQAVEARRPKTVLEIGTAKGGTLYLLCQAAADDATIISLDLPYGRNGGGFPQWKEPAYRQFIKPGQTLHLVRGNSHDASSLEAVKALLGPDQDLDFLLIDGDHSHEGVRQDFDMYAPLISEGGMVAVHDILENRFDPSIDVHHFWAWAQERYRTEEIVDDPEQGNFGIGIVHSPA